MIQKIKNLFRKDYCGYPRFFFVDCLPKDAEAWVHNTEKFGHRMFLEDFCVDVCDEYKPYYIPVKMRRIFYALTRFWKNRPHVGE